MNNNPYSPSFLQRHLRPMKELAVMALIVGFAVSYNNVPAIQNVVDMGVRPAVAGITVLYGKLATEIYKLSRLDFGFVTIPPDQEFLFSVRLATYINERRAGPLFDIGVDSRHPAEKRQRALLAILKFETTSDWIQPFLNELPKGGLLGMYDDQAPLLDELIKKIRAEGGVRQALVRAYAEVVFSFMLQVPDLVVRRHACQWLSDVIAEDAVFLLVPRLDKEKDPKGQESIETALYDVRAVSEPDTAKELLLPFYKKPPWPSLRLPLATVLARLGYVGALAYVNNALKSPTLTGDQRLALNLAAAKTPYPRQLKVSEQEEALLASRQRERQDQMRFAMEKRERIFRQERLRQEVLARARQEKAGAETAVVPPPAVEQVPATEETKTTIAEKPAEATAPVPEKPVAPALVGKKAETRKVAMAVPPPVPVKQTAAQKAERVPPKQFLPVPGALTEEEKAAAKAGTKPAQEQMASLPEENLPPPLEQPAPKAKSLMNYVDMIFEIKRQEVPLFQNPGDNPTGVVLPVGTKGKADFEVLIGEDHWYQVKSKKGSGWANGKFLSLFNLSPMGSLPPVATEAQQAPPQEGSLEGGRKESTYFETSIENAPIFDKPSEKARKVGELTEDVAYLAVRSEKVGADRWFLLQIRTGETAWARGLDLRLANVQQPAELQIPTKPLSQRDKKSAFAAEWVVAGVKGVGIYSRPSIAGKMIQQINPPDVYKVVETFARDGKEWYRIQLSKKKDGWVQTMDVNLTKRDSE